MRFQVLFPSLSSSLKTDSSSKRPYEADSQSKTTVFKNLTFSHHLKRASSFRTLSCPELCSLDVFYFCTSLHFFGPLLFVSSPLVHTPTLHCLSWFSLSQKQADKTKVILTEISPDQMFSIRNTITGEKFICEIPLSGKNVK